MDLRVLHFDWNWQLASSAESLWPLISDTNRLNKNLNLPPIQTADLSYALKEGHNQLAYNSLQNSDAWEEEPYQWERPYRFGVKRNYKNGSYETLKIQVDLQPNAHGTRVQYQIWATTRNLFAYYVTPGKFSFLLRRKLKKTFRTYDQLIQKNKLSYEVEKKQKLVRGAHQRILTYQKTLNETTGRTDIVARLIKYLRHAHDIDVARISPFKLADHWNFSRQDVLAVFLHATKEGILNFNWDLYCPHCRSLEQCSKTLNEIHEPVFCEECQDEFYVNFNQNIQLSFSPNPLIRKIPEAVYCLTGPQTKSHIAVKQYIKAGEKRYLKIHLEKGIYKLRIAGQPGIADVTVDEAGKDNISVVVNRFGLDGEEVIITPDSNLVFHNSSSEPQIFILEKKDWDKHALTAAEVTSLQLFRDLFDKEVLRKGEKIAADSLTFMFTDLLDSASMYNKEGDETAVVRVIEHFEILQKVIAAQNGAIVKTIGDSVMAVFSSPANAFRAFLKAYELITNDERFSQRLKLKAGIHHGNCVAVNLHNNIDYFGSTVNMAARLVDFADKNEIVLSESANEILNQVEGSDIQYRSQEIQVTLRGFEDEQFTIKRIGLEKSNLRLVV